MSWLSKKIFMFFSFFFYNNRIIQNGLMHHLKIFTIYSSLFIGTNCSISIVAVKNKYLKKSLCKILTFKLKCQKIVITHKANVSTWISAATWRSIGLANCHIPCVETSLQEYSRIDYNWNVFIGCGCGEFNEFFHMSHTYYWVYN